jgi:ATP-dependent Clp protease ATP-binding subunit ClpA
MSIANTLKKMVLSIAAFQKVLVDPPSAEEAEHILHNIKSKYEDFHNVSYSDEAIRGLRETQRPVYQ